MRYRPLLGLDFVGPVLEIVRLKIPHVHAGDEEWCLGEEVLHLFERASGRLGENCPEEDGVGEIADLDRVNQS